MRPLSRSTEFVFVGIASVALQVVFLRMLVGLLGSSEILYAIIITIWLVETGLWSLIAEWIAGRSVSAANSVLIAAYLSICAIVPLYQLLPAIKGSLFSSYGAVPLSECGLFCMLALILPTTYPGAAFALIYFAKNRSRECISVGRAYYLDSLGFAIAGLLLALLFAIIGRDLSLLILIGGVGLIACAIMRLKRSLAIVAAAIGCLALLYSVYDFGNATSLWLAGRSSPERSAESYISIREIDRQMPQFIALSPYGRIVFRQDRLGGYLYYNSELVCTEPDPETSEEIVIPLAMCEHRKAICVIGNSCDGKALFALNDPSVSVTQVEPDPVLYGLLRQRLDAMSLSDDIVARMHPVHGDPVDFLVGTQESFDLILLNYSDPSGIAHSNLFTSEFFELVRSRLTRGGVIAFSAKCGENFIQPERLEYLKNLCVTLAGVFPHVQILPGEDAILIGGMELSRITSDPFEILANLSEYQNDLQYYGEAYLPDRFSEFRVEKLQRSLASVEGRALSVAKPAQFLLNATLEMDKFGGIDSGILRGLRSLPAIVLMVVVILPMLAFAAVATLRSRKINPYLPAFYAGWFGLSFELLLIVVYQSVAGNLYSRLGMLAGLFVGGVAVGAWIGSRITMADQPGVRYLKIAVLAGLFLSLAAAFATSGMLARFEQRTTLEMLILALSAVAGIVPGCVFNLSVGMNSQEGRDASPGRFYAADLYGSALGGLATSLLILPLLGIQTGFVVISSISLLVLVYLQFRT
ncbi:MAG: hypothetical protein KKG33_15250 [candidate division Zixibacteria bacterium]|nr:hypothetical protein [candidate division Zixibacteria bacterium]